MLNEISTILRKKSFSLAEQTIKSLPDHSKIMTYFIEDTDDTYSIYIDLIHTLLSSTESGDLSEVIKKAQELSFFRAQHKVPVRYTIERIRRFRTLISKELEEISRQYSSIEEYKKLMKYQQELNSTIDLFIECFICSYESSMNELVNRSDALHDYDDWLKDLVWVELSQLVMFSRDIAVLIIDNNLKIKEANHALSEILHVKREDIIDKNIDDILKPHSDHRYIQWVVERGEHGHYVADYGGKWLTISTRPLRQNSELWGAIAVIRDLTHSKSLENEMTRREALASVGQLAAGMAHEIRNPLTSIKGFIQLIQEQSDSNEHAPYYSVILSEIERIDGLINDVLVLAKYRDDNLEAEAFQVTEEVIGVIRLLEPELNRHGIAINLKVDAINTWTYGYRPRIKQVFLNLVKNALEALVQSGSAVHIHVFATINQVVVTVEDDGPGIPDSVRQYLFMPFFTTKSEGTGLGLSTSQRIVADHGGDIFVENSSQYGGARFEVRLPILKEM